MDIGGGKAGGLPDVLCRFSGNRPEPGACDQSRGELCILRDEPETGSLEQPGGNV